MNSCIRGVLLKFISSRQHEISWCSWKQTGVVLDPQPVGFIKKVIGIEGYLHIAFARSVINRRIECSKRWHFKCTVKPRNSAALGIHTNTDTQIFEF